ncbi:MAG: hypothetical protein A2W99_17410 [Bacteroidetes bacterium GWF2_33_16]|nr:MAG: hypothetical protein A2X00_14550 [Bacteroidetes bacterium GWE2_32_14]OFY06817.1 MAG: hypothetical protein A2W99_17410 [Bacteroidetes bacterium GWF2_33_16]
MSVVSLILLTSYNNPNLNGANIRIKYSLYELQENIQNTVITLQDNISSETSQNIKNKLNELVANFYENRNYQPVWTTDYESNSHFKTFANILDSTKYYGFPIDYFDNLRIKALKDEFTKTKSLASRINLELATTNSAFKLMLYMNRGITEKDTSVAYSEFLNSLPALLQNALSQSNFKNEILALQPDLVQFQKIITSLPNFIDLQLSIKFTTPKFIDDNLLAKGLYYAGVTETAEIDSSDNNSKAIYKLQEKFNLPKDSILNSPTHQFLVNLLQYRYYQTCLNLQRLRALQSTDEDFIFVNIPEFKLHVIESKQEKEIFNVIVGKQETPTPIFSSNIEKVITNPYWTVPKSIVLEMLPKIRKDSTYLERNGYCVINWREETIDMSTINWNTSDPLGVKYYLRQKNSSSNALGLVKFLFPNEHDVYLHDTPSRGLFNVKNRTFSHGCIRLENPDKLAQYLTNKYNTESYHNIKNLISSQKNNEITLAQKVKIHIQYITCSGNENSDMEFYGDIYNLDKQEITAIFPDQIEL